MTSFEHAAEQAHRALLNHEQEIGSQDADQLFYASYLLGHLSLIAATEGRSRDELEQKVADNLDEAFAIDRLSDQDKAGIRSLWQAISADIGREP